MRGTRLDRAVLANATLRTFSGAPSAFEANPFNLTFDVSPEDVNGLPKPPAPVKKAPVAAKKAATKKK